MFPMLTVSGHTSRKKAFIQSGHKMLRGVNVIFICPILMAMSFHLLVRWSLACWVIASHLRRAARRIPPARLRVFPGGVLRREAHCDLRSRHNAPADKRNHHQVGDTQDVFAPAK
jgi:hypothetical protein